MSAPEAHDSARANRAFLQRAVRFLAGEAGIRQIIDIGTGIPAAGNVHQVAAQIAPGTRVAYVVVTCFVTGTQPLLRMAGTRMAILIDGRWQSRTLKDVLRGHDAECPHYLRTIPGDPGGNCHTQPLTGQADATAVLPDGDRVATVRHHVLQWQYGWHDHHPH